MDKRPIPETPDLRMFCYYWMITGDRKRSLLLANYYGKCGVSKGGSYHQHWKRPSTQRMLNKVVEEMAGVKRKLKVQRPTEPPEAKLAYVDDVIATAEEVLIYLTACMRGNISEEVLMARLTEPGVQVIERLRKEVTPKDRTKAAELLAKRYGLLEQKVALSISTPVVFQGEDELEA